MMRFPLLPTALVAAAVAAMVALGIWQLQRAGEKDALAARYEQNAKLPPMALVQTKAADESILFRRASAFCLEVTRWRKTGGKSASGKGGTRFIAECRTGAEGPGFAADMGVSRDPKAEARWAGGEVIGTVVPEPSEAGIFERLTGKAPPARPMIVSERPAAGLEASARPQGDVPNNSRFYAFQWFFFALAAAAIYVLALRRRGRERLPPAA